MLMYDLPSIVSAVGRGAAYAGVRERTSGWSVAMIGGTPLAFDGSI